MSLFLKSPIFFDNKKVTHFDVILLPRDFEQIEIVSASLRLQIKFVQDPIKLGARMTDWSRLATKHISIAIWRFLHKCVKIYEHAFPKNQLSSYKFL